MRGDIGDGSGRLINCGPDGDIQGQGPRPSVDLYFDGTTARKIVGSARDQLRSVERNDSLSLTALDQGHHLTNDWTM